MRTTYNQFLKIYEAQGNIISLKEVEEVIKNVFAETKVSSVSTLYEKEDDKNKFIITINNLFYEETNIIHTKFVFYTDDKKRGLQDNHFHYQYNINCVYKQVDFESASELEEKIKNIVDNRKFGNDIKILSDLSVTMASDVNTLLKKQDITSVSIFNITYVPIVDAVPCDSLTFRFDINIDDIRFIKMVIKKVGKGEFRITFRENEWNEDVTIGSLKAIPQTITEMIKNHII